MDRLKPEINNLLHQFLPDDIMLKEVEVLVMVINEMVWNPRNFLGSLPNEKESKQETFEDVAERLYPIKTESDLTSIVKRVVNENESNSDDILNERPEKKLNVSDVSDSLTPKETLTLLMKIWERIPLGTRMSCGGMEREIPKEIRELLNKFGYKIVKK
jgi:hypothetical protein